MNQSRITSFQAGVGRLFEQAGSRTATNLNSAFVNATSGAAIAIRFMAHTTDPIDELYVFLDSNGGTLGSVTMAAEIFNEGSNAARPGTTSRDTSTTTTMPGAVDKWIKFEFATPYTPAVGEILWLVIYNTSGTPGTDYPGILAATNIAIGPAVSSTGIFAAFQTTNGFTTDGTSIGELPWVVKAGSTYYGQPFTQINSTYYTSNTRQRGIVITPTEDVSVNGVSFKNGVSNYNELKIYADATAPGGSAISTHDLDSDANETTGDICGGKTFAAETLTGGSTYKAALTFSSSSQSPWVVQTEDYSSYSSVFDALRAQDTINVPWSAIDDGASGWTIDKAVSPLIMLHIDDNPAQAGGGGGPLIGGRLVL